MAELLTERILIRVTPSLKTALEDLAVGFHIRLQDVCRNALAEYVTQRSCILTELKEICDAQSQHE